MSKKPGLYKSLIIGVIVLFIGVGIQPVIAFTNNGDNNPPYAPRNPYPTGEFPVDVDVNLSWDGGDPDSGDTVTYYVYFGTYEPPTPHIATLGPYPWNQTRMEYDILIELIYGETYYWIILAYDNNGQRNQGPCWSFRTIAPNLPPSKPIIDGPDRGKPRKEYEYVFINTDVDDNESYLWIEWGDNNSTRWLGPFENGKSLKFSHKWNKEGTFIVRAKAKDIHGAESEWSKHEIAIPRTRATIHHWLLERFPMLERLLSLLL